MASAQYIATDNETIATSQDHRNTLEEDPLLSSTVDPYVPQQHRTYLQYLIPLVAIFIFPLTFATVVSARGRVAVPQKLARLGMAYPQVKGQIVTILATSLTATTRWALGGAAALLARKRLLRPRPVYEINMFFNLTNISVIWDWKHRRRMMFLTWLLVALCGLLTSGFFTLLNPLMVEVHSPYPPAREINLAADSGLWEKWCNASKYPSLFGSSGTWYMRYSTSNAPSLLQSMTKQYLASKKRGNDDSVRSFVTTFEELKYTSFNGSTAGALISGEDRPSGQPSYPLGKPENSSYSLNLQGTWIDVSCSTGRVPPLSVTMDDSIPFEGEGGNKSYSFTCPGSSTPRIEMTRFMWEGVVALDCPMEGGTTAIFFKNIHHENFRPLDNITCIASPQIGDVNVIMKPQVDAFNVTGRSAPISSLPPVARTITSLILGLAIQHFKYIPIFSSTSQAWSVLGDGTYLSERVIEEITEMALSALFEFEASYSRLRLMEVSKNLTNLPPEAIREVDVMLIEHTIGWEMKWTTWLGLLPLVTVCVIAFTMLAMAWCSEGGLTMFDPMSPVSLLGATSVGEVVLPNQGLCRTIGAPLDENVLTTRVSYTKRDETWGLWSLGDGGEGSIKGSV